MARKVNLNADMGEGFGDYDIGNDTEMLKVIGSANEAGAEALVLSCPLCEYNLGSRQSEVVAMGESLEEVPTLYFTQLLGIALGLEPDLYRLDLAGRAARDLLTEKKFVAAAAV